jgi:hypothetical protein
MLHQLRNHAVPACINTVSSVFFVMNVPPKCRILRVNCQNFSGGYIPWLPIVAGSHPSHTLGRALRRLRPAARDLCSSNFLLKKFPGHSHKFYLSIELAIVGLMPVRIAMVGIVTQNRIEILFLKIYEVCSLYIHF